MSEQPKAFPWLNQASLQHEGQDRGEEIDKQEGNEQAYQPFQAAVDGPLRTCVRQVTDELQFTSGTYDFFGSAPNSDKPKSRKPELRGKAGTAAF